MRGKALISIKDVKQARITPAYAGKSCWTVLVSTDFWDHPRVCGEKHIDKRIIHDGIGSPPRMRGKGGLYR